jgi:hypothetical protein
MPGISIERIDLSARRESKLTHCPVGATTFPGDSSRLNVRLIMQTPTPPASTQAVLSVQGKNNVGNPIQLTIAGVNENCPQADLDLYTHGTIIFSELVVTVTGVTDCVLMETFRH